jgi:Ca2+-binding EF-hand superfamily protein
MKTSAKVLLAIGALALGTTAMAGASLADGRWGHGPHGHHHGGPGWGGPRGGEFLFEQFDVNKDGTITQAEIDEVRQNRLAEFDQNKDGKLSLEEYQALWMDAMRERMVDRFQDLDDDGDAVVTVEEFVAPFDSMVDHMDRNDDGKITKDDLRRGPPHRPHDRDDDEGDDG